MHSDPNGSGKNGPGPVAKATEPGPVAAGGSNEAADLARARRQLLTGGPETGPGTRNPAGHGRRLDAAALRHALVDLHEFWLTTKGAELGIKPDSGFALVAVGGLGRREMLPYSDLDLLLLHDDMDPAVVSQVADQLWYPLWDAHIKLDHSVRTIPQALQVADTDITAALGMLEARHIAGDMELTNLLISGVRRQWRMDIRSRFDDLIAQTQSRWASSGEIAHRAEPDL